jgi:mono/diheme cytochrome c family protein
MITEILNRAVQRKPVNRRSRPTRNVRFGFSGIIATVFFFALAVAVASAQKDNPAAEKKNDAVYAELNKVPSKAINRRNPLEKDTDSVAAGAKLFDLHCAECHGAEAQGGRKAPSLLVPQVQQASPGTLFWILTNGVVRRGMPVWSKLPEPQRWQIVTYIKSFSSSKPPVDEQKPTQGSQGDTRPPGSRRR